MLCLVRCSGLVFRPASLCFFFILFIYLFIFLISKQEKGKIKGEGSIKTCGVSLKVSEAWVKGRESFFSFVLFCS